MSLFQHAPNRRRSRSADSPASPHSAKSAKREETRNRLRAGGFEFSLYGGAIEVDMILYGFIYWKLNMLMLIILL